MMRIVQEFGRNELEQFFFHFRDVFPGCNPCAIGDPEDMSVDRNRRLSERGVEYHIGSLAAHTRECL